MRVAWIGPTPSDGGGVSYAATMLLLALLERGVQIDCYHVATEVELAQSLASASGLRVVARSRRVERLPRSGVLRFVVGQAAKGLTQRSLAREMAARHAREPYDLIYQFSQLELLTLRRLRERLPPIVVHPEVHAAGELKWLVRERRLARFEPVSRRVLVLCLLAARSAAQRRDLRVARMLIAPSEAFAAAVSSDYRLTRDRIAVVPNPIDLNRFVPCPRAGANSPLRLLFVSRLAVRKGLEMVVDLSHRLDDLAGRVVIDVVGDRSLWSDYRPLLGGVNRRVAHYRGSVDPQDVAAVYHDADALLQPSHYEPFGLTVGEALASGLPVVASTAVGAAEHVDAECCRRFSVGDVDAFETATRQLVAELSGGRYHAIATKARDEAERLFSPASVGSALIAQLERAAA